MPLALKRPPATVVRRLARQEVVAKETSTTVLAATTRLLAEQVVALVVKGLATETRQGPRLPEVAAQVVLLPSPAPSRTPRLVVPDGDDGLALEVVPARDGGHVEVRPSEGALVADSRDFFVSRGQVTF